MKYKYVILIILLIFISIFSYFYLNKNNTIITSIDNNEKIYYNNYTLDKSIILKLINQN